MKATLLNRLSRSFRPFSQAHLQEKKCLKDTFCISTRYYFPTGYRIMVIKFQAQLNCFFFNLLGTSYPSQKKRIRIYTCTHFPRSPEIQLNQCTSKGCLELKNSFKTYNFHWKLNFQLVAYPRQTIGSSFNKNKMVVQDWNPKTTKDFNWMP